MIKLTQIFLQWADLIRHNNLINMGLLIKVLQNEMDNNMLLIINHIYLVVKKYKLGPDKDKEEVDHLD